MQNSHAASARRGLNEGILTSSLSPQGPMSHVTARVDSREYALRLMSSFTDDDVRDLSGSGSLQEVMNVLLHSLNDKVSVIEKSVLEWQQFQEKSEQTTRNLMRAELDSFKSLLAASQQESRARLDQLLGDTKLAPVQPLQATIGTHGSLIFDLNNLLEKYDQALKTVVQDFQLGKESSGNHLSNEPLSAAAVFIETDVEVAPPERVDNSLRPSAALEAAAACAERDVRVATLEKGDSSPFPSAAVDTHNSVVQDRYELFGRGAPKLWVEFQEAVEHNDSRSMYARALTRKLAQRSFWHDIFDYFHVGWLVDHQSPNTWGAWVTQHWAFTAFSTTLIVCNTCLMGYEADQSMKAALHNTTSAQWLDKCNLVFNIIFAAELLFKMLALRTWFFVCPAEWAWNMFDVFLVVTGLVSDLLNGINLSYMRTLRILRAVRAARIIRVLRIFRQLRQMLLSILACLSSLSWTFIFLAMIMFMFSILFLSGTANFVHDLQDMPDSEGKDSMLYETEKWYGSLGSSMFSLLAAVTGGGDWIIIKQPLDSAGHLYAIAFVVYMLLVTVGVMNVLTGVFLSSAQEFMDLDLIVQNEQLRIETFCQQMMQLFEEMDTEGTGEVDWPMFEKALRETQVQHYLASLQLEPTHVGLIFELLDENRSGKLAIDEFVMGMVRLKGESKAIDARIIQRELGMIPMLIRHMFKKSLLSGQTDI